MKDTQFYVIAYDIPNDRRRARIHKTLCGFGQWTQFSLFECFLNAKEIVKLRVALDNIVDVSEDSVRIYRMCATCLDSVETIGSTQPEEKTLYIM